MPSQIKDFFESAGKLELDDEETPEICFLKPYDGTYGHAIAMSVSEFIWINCGQINSLCEGRPGDEWLYWGGSGWVSEEEMLSLIEARTLI